MQFPQSNARACRSACGSPAKESRRQQTRLGCLFHKPSVMVRPNPARELFCPMNSGSISRFFSESGSIDG